jgi:hypothetical protein
MRKKKGTRGGRGGDREREMWKGFEIEKVKDGE